MRAAKRGREESPSEDIESGPHRNQPCQQSLLPPGTLVTVRDLQSATGQKINGKRARIQAWFPDKTRYLVQPFRVLLKPANVILTPTDEVDFKEDSQPEMESSDDDVCILEGDELAAAKAEGIGGGGGESEMREGGGRMKQTIMK